MRDLVADLRYALRALARRPAFSLPLVLVLALGIAGATTMFSVLYGVVLRPLPFPDPDRIVLIPGASYVDLDWWAKAPSIVHLGTYSIAGVNLTGEAGPERAQVASVSSGFFPVLGIAPQHGRVFTREDQLPGQRDVVLLSDGVWARRFGRDPAVIGSRLYLNNLPYTVVGILPRRFSFPGHTELWIPTNQENLPVLGGTADQHELPDFLDSRVIGRLHPGATLEQAGAELEVLRLQLKKRYEGTNVGVGDYVGIRSYHRMLTWEVRPALVFLFVSVAFVLLIACANVASLLLARAASREKEIAVRLCLGATRARIARLVVAEGLLLAMVGGTLGAFLSYWGLDVIRAAAPAKVPRLSEVTVDHVALLFALGVSLLVGVSASLPPALAGFRSDLARSIAQGGTGAAGGNRTRARSLLVITEIALALLLVAGATLMVQSLFLYESVPPGFDVGNIATMTVAIPPDLVPSLPARVTLYERILRDCSSLPGVAAVGGTHRLPLASTAGFQYFDTGDGRTNIQGQTNVVFGDYFRAMGIPLLAGRLFADQDGVGATPVMIVSQKLAQILSPDGNVLGRHVRPLPESTPREIVGVVGNTKHQGLEEDDLPHYYVPLFGTLRPDSPASRSTSDFVLVVRTHGDATAMLPQMRRAMHSVDKTIVTFRLRTMEDVFHASTAAFRFRAILMAAFSSAGLVLAVMGIYSLVSYWSVSRTREIGIRMALGAEPRNIMGLMLAQIARLALWGALLGVGGGVALGWLLSRLVFGVAPTDPLTLAASAVALLAVAVLGALIPARRASRVHPAEALRYE